MVCNPLDVLVRRSHCLHEFEFSKVRGVENSGDRLQSTHLSKPHPLQPGEWCERWKLCHISQSVKTEESDVGHLWEYGHVAQASYLVDGEILHSIGATDD